jgi:hypothetical protein
MSTTVNTTTNQRAFTWGDILLFPLTVLFLLCGLFVGYLYASFHNGFKWGFKLMHESDEAE